MTASSEQAGAVLELRLSCVQATESISRRDTATDAPPQQATKPVDTCAPEADTRDPRLLGPETETIVKPREALAMFASSTMHLWPLIGSSGARDGGRGALRCRASGVGLFSRNARLGRAGAPSLSLSARPCFC